MSKLYLSADTDMIRTTHTARGNRRVDARVGYNEGNYSDKIKLEVIRDEEKLKLFLSDKMSPILSCKGTIQDGIVECKINQMYTI